MASAYKTASKARRKFKTQRKTALGTGDVTGASVAARKMRTQANLMRTAKGKKVKGKLKVRTTPSTKKKVIPAVDIRETSKTHGNLWSQRWDTGGLNKTFGTRTRYGQATRPDRWTEMTRTRAPEIQPEFTTGPFSDKSAQGGWGGAQWGRRGAQRPRWVRDPITRKWRRG